MSWKYDLFNCLRYNYPNEPHGPERPSNPPIPPAGWPLPRVGEVIPVDQHDDRFTPFKTRVIGVEWDYEVPRVTVQLEVVREPDLNTIQFDPLDEDNHGDRLLADGRRLVRSFRGHWHTLQADCRLNCGSAPDLGPRLTLARWDRCYGPLTFAPEPDPLDEADHRDRVDEDGLIVRRKGHERWAWPGQRGFHHENVGWPLNSINASDGPLTFARDASPAPQDAAQGAADGESDAVEGCGPAEPSEALLCHECGHDIEHHTGLGCLKLGCPCQLSITDIARHWIAQAAYARKERP